MLFLVRKLITYFSGQSLLELLPLELLNIVVHDVIDADPFEAIAIKLVSKTIYTALKKTDGTPFANIPRRTKYDKTDVSKVMQVQQRIEAGWHKPRPGSFYCTQCNLVEPRTAFADSHRTKVKKGRFCVPCGLELKTRYRFGKFKLNGIMVKQCNDCHEIKSADEISFSMSTAHDYLGSLICCIKCRASCEARGWADKSSYWYPGHLAGFIEASYDQEAFIKSGGDSHIPKDGRRLNGIIEWWHDHSRRLGGKGAAAIITAGAEQQSRVG